MLKGKKFFAFLSMILMLVMISFIGLYCTDDEYIDLPTDVIGPTPTEEGGIRYQLVRVDETHHELKEINPEADNNKCKAEGKQIDPMLSLFTLIGDVTESEAGYSIVFGGVDFDLSGFGIEGSLVVSVDDVFLDTNNQLDCRIAFGIPEIIEGISISISHGLADSALDNPGEILVGDLIEAEFWVNEFQLALVSDATIDMYLRIVKLAGMDSDLTLGLDGELDIMGLVNSSGGANIGIYMFGGLAANIGDLLTALGPLLGLEEDALDLPLGLDIGAFDVSLDIASDEHPIEIDFGMTSLSDLSLGLKEGSDPDPIVAAISREEDRIVLELLTRVIDMSEGLLDVDIMLDAYGHLAIPTDIVDLHLTIADEIEHLTLGLTVNGEMDLGLGGGGGDSPLGLDLGGLNIGLSLENSPEPPTPDLKIALLDNREPQGELYVTVDISILDVVLPDQFAIDISGEANGSVVFEGQEVADLLAGISGSELPIDLSTYTLELSAGNIGLDVTADNGQPIDIVIASDPNDLTGIFVDAVIDGSPINLFDIGLLLNGTMHIPSIDLAEGINIEIDDLNPLTLSLAGGMDETPFEFIRAILEGMGDLIDLSSMGALLDLFNGTKLWAAFPEYAPTPLEPPLTPGYDTLDIVLTGDLENLGIEFAGAPGQDLKITLDDSPGTRWGIELTADVQNLEILDISSFEMNAELEISLNGYGNLSGGDISNVLTGLGTELPAGLAIDDFEFRLNLAYITASIIATAGSDIVARLGSATGSGLSINYLGTELLTLYFGINGPIIIPADMENEEVSFGIDGQPVPDDAVRLSLYGTLTEFPISNFIGILSPLLGDMEDTLTPIFDFLSETTISGTIPDVTAQISGPMSTLSGNLYTSSAIILSMEDDQTIETQSDFDFHMTLDVPTPGFTFDLSTFDFNGDASLALYGSGDIYGSDVGGIIDALSEDPLPIDLSNFLIGAHLGNFGIDLHAATGADIEIDISGDPSSITIDRLSPLTNIFMLAFEATGGIVIPVVVETDPIAFNPDLVVKMYGALNEFPIADFMGIVEDLAGEFEGIDPILTLLGDATVQGTIPESVTITASGDIDNIGINVITTNDITLSIIDDETTAPATPSTFTLSADLSIDNVDLTIASGDMSYTGDLGINIDGDAYFAGLDLEALIETPEPGGLGMDIDVDLSNYAFEAEIDNINIGAIAATDDPIYIDITSGSSSSFIIDIGGTDYATINFGITGGVTIPIDGSAITIGSLSYSDITAIISGSINNLELEEMLGLVTGMLGDDLAQIEPVIDLLSESELSASIPNISIIVTGTLDELAIDVTSGGAISLTLFDNWDIINPSLFDITLALAINPPGISVLMGDTPDISGGISLSITGPSSPLTRNFVDGADLQGILDVLAGTLPIGVYDPDPVDGYKIDLEADFSGILSLTLNLSMGAGGTNIDAQVSSGNCSLMILFDAAEFLNVSFNISGGIDMPDGGDMAFDPPVVLNLWGNLASESTPFAISNITGILGGLIDDMTSFEPILNFLDETNLYGTICSYLSPFSLTIDGDMGTGMTISATAPDPDNPISATVYDELTSSSDSMFDLTAQLNFPMPGFTIEYIPGGDPETSFSGVLMVDIFGGTHEHSTSIDSRIFGSDLDSIINSLLTDPIPLDLGLFDIYLDIPGLPNNLNIEVEIEADGDISASINDGNSPTFDERDYSLDIYFNNSVFLNATANLQGGIFVPSDGTMTIGSLSPPLPDVNVNAWGSIVSTNVGDLLDELLPLFGGDLGQMEALIDIFTEAYIGATLANETDPLMLTASGPVDALAVHAECNSDITGSIVDNTGNTQMDLSASINPILLDLLVADPLEYSGNVGLLLGGFIDLYGDDLQSILEGMEIAGAGTSMEDLDISHTGGVGLDVYADLGTPGQAASIVIDSSLAVDNLVLTLPGTNPFVTLDADIGTEPLLDVWAKLSGGLNLTMSSGDMYIDNVTVELEGSVGPVNFSPSLSNLVTMIGIETTGILGTLITLLGDSVIDGAIADANILTGGDRLTLVASGTLDTLTAVANLDSQITVNITESVPPTIFALHLELTENTLPTYLVNLDLSSDPMAYDGGLGLSIWGNLFMHGNDLQVLLGELGLDLNGLDVSHTAPDGLALDIAADFGAYPGLTATCVLDSTTGIDVNLPGGASLSLVADIGDGGYQAYDSEILLAVNADLEGDLSVALPAGDIALDVLATLDGSLGDVHFSPNLKNAIGGLGLDLTDYSFILNLLNDTIFSGTIDPITAQLIMPNGNGNMEAHVNCAGNISLGVLDNVASTLLDIMVQIGNLSLNLELPDVGDPIYDGSLDLVLRDGGQIANTSAFLYGDDLNAVLVGLDLITGLDVSHASGIGLDIDLDLPTVSPYVTATIGVDSASYVDIVFNAANQYIELSVDIDGSTLGTGGLKIAGDVHMDMAGGTGGIYIGNVVGAAYSSTLDISLYLTLGPIQIHPNLTGLLSIFSLDLSSMDFILTQLTEAFLEGSIGDPTPLTVSLWGASDAIEIWYAGGDGILARIYDESMSSTNLSANFELGIGLNSFYTKISDFLTELDVDGFGEMGGFIQNLHIAMDMNDDGDNTDPEDLNLDADIVAGSTTPSATTPIITYSGTPWTPGTPVSLNVTKTGGAQIINLVLDGGADALLIRVDDNPTTFSTASSVALALGGDIGNDHITNGTKSNVSVGLDLSGGDSFIGDLNGGIAAFIKLWRMEGDFITGLMGSSLDLMGLQHLIGNTYAHIDIGYSGGNKQIINCDYVPGTPGQIVIQVRPNPSTYFGDLDLITITGGYTWLDCKAYLSTVLVSPTGGLRLPGDLATFDALEADNVVLKLKGTIDMNRNILGVLDLNATMGELLDSFLDPGYTGTNRADFSNVLAYTDILGLISENGVSSVNPLTVILDGTLENIAATIQNLYVKLTATIDSPTKSVDLPDDRGAPCNSATNCYPIDMASLGGAINLVDVDGCLGAKLFGVCIGISYDYNLNLSRIRLRQLELCADGGQTLGILLQDGTGDSVIQIDNTSGSMELVLGGMEPISVDIYKNPNTTSVAALDLLVGVELELTGTADPISVLGWHETTIGGQHILCSVNSSGDLQTGTPGWAELYGDAVPNPDELNLRGGLGTQLSVDIAQLVGAFIGGLIGDLLEGLIRLIIGDYYQIDLPILKPGDAMTLFP